MDRIAEIRARIAAVDLARREAEEKANNVPKRFTLNQAMAELEAKQRILLANAVDDVRFLLAEFDRISTKAPAGT